MECVSTAVLVMSISYITRDCIMMMLPLHIYVIYVNMRLIVNKHSTNTSKLIQVSFKIIVEYFEYNSSLIIWIEGNSHSNIINPFCYATQIIKALDSFL